ncbi:hypothetical protein THRCLA_22770 [Thraustotheca clavata]|uniref:Transmembrane protein n=1 Tax=Thraustotheca clavata TaxID=74557 RepID=A0A1V9YT18_9STRA|nr:hypothetical protein THRCLA_22770 [Thraustotheca clavata]
MGVCCERSKGRRVVLGLFIVLTLTISLLLVLILANVFQIKSKAMWIEMCIQILNAILTCAALIVHPGRFLTLMRLVCYSSNSDVAAENAIQTSFPSLPVEFLDQENPQGINVPIRKLLLFMFVLNLQCFLQYPVTITVWFYSYTHRPYYIIAIALALSCLCTILAVVWEHQMHQTTIRYRAKRAESAIERFLVEDTSI